MLIDFVPNVGGVSLSEAPSFKKAPGGAPANVAVGIARLGGFAAFIGKNKKDGDGNDNEAIVIKDIIVMVSDVCAMLHVCNYKAQFKTYEESSIFVPYEESSMELEVFVDIHSKAKLHGKCIVEVNLSFD
uniref:Carbohydrate kinase PfkB domain-containing protein n=1 Tax=Quercus lobata TaxID=97700 RepID=A0A7N2MDS5_QUELO